MSLPESSVLDLVHECQVACFLIPVILDGVVLKCLVSCSLQIISQWLERRLKVVTEAEVTSEVLSEIIMRVEQVR